MGGTQGAYLYKYVFAVNKDDENTQETELEEIALKSEENNVNKT